MEHLVAVDRSSPWVVLMSVRMSVPSRDRSPYPSAADLPPGATRTAAPRTAPGQDAEQHAQRFAVLTPMECAWIWRDAVSSGTPPKGDKRT
jgi:hypothetical protein